MNAVTKGILLTPFNILYKLSPKLDLKLLFLLKRRERLDLKDPKTYNQKIQWIKLYDRNPLMPRCVDKYTVRGVVEELGCAQQLNRLLWSGFDPADIPFDTLPERFVIKVTHGSGFNIFCRDKASFDREEAVRKCRRWLKNHFIPCYGEWFYGIEKPRVIVEEFIESDDGQQLRDYKIFCFHGEPRYVRVDSDRFTGHKTDLFTPDWKRIENTHMGFPCSPYRFERPTLLDEMLDCARKLSKPFLHARVDLYISGGRVYFGEITFCNGSGFDRFYPDTFDAEMGSHLTLPLNNGKRQA